MRSPFAKWVLTPPARDTDVSVDESAGLNIHGRHWLRRQSLKGHLCQNEIQEPRESLTGVGVVVLAMVANEESASPGNRDVDALHGEYSCNLEVVIWIGGPVDREEGQRNNVGPKQRVQSGMKLKRPSGNDSVTRKSMLRSWFGSEA